MASTVLEHPVDKTDAWDLTADIFDPPAQKNDGFREWIPFPKQQLAISAAQIAVETLFGGSAGPGKTALLLEYMVREMERYPGNRGLIVRRVMPSLTKSVIPRLKTILIPSQRAVWKAEPKEFHFPNGSILELGSCQYAENTMNYAGAEYGVIACEEVTELIPSQYIFFLSRLRAPQPGIRPHMFSTTNPGGPFHKFYKDRFVSPPGNTIPDDSDTLLDPEDQYVYYSNLTPMRNRHILPGTIWRPKPVKGVDKLEEPPPLRVYIPATHTDNPKLAKNSPTYMAQLRANPNAGMRKALEEGDWDAIDQIEGAYWNVADIEGGRISEDWYERYIEPEGHFVRALAIDPSSGKKDAYSITWGSQRKGKRNGDIYILGTKHLGGPSNDPEKPRKKYTPLEMAQETVKLCKEHDIDFIVLETNHGGDWIKTTLLLLNPLLDIRTVWASKGKRTRAEPIASLFQENHDREIPYMARFVGHHEETEEVLTTHVFDDDVKGQASPDAMDSLVWLCTAFTDPKSYAKRESKGKDNRLQGRR